MKTRSTAAKEMLRSNPSVVNKKRRSELPRRRRTRVSPIVKVRRNNLSLSSHSVDSCSSTYLGGEATSESSRVYVQSEKRPSNTVPRKRKFEESEIRRDFALVRQNDGVKDEPEVSESSCVESSNFGDKKRLKLKSKRGRRIGTANEIDKEEEISKGVSISEITCVSGAENSNVLLDVKELNEVVSCVSGAESNFKEKPQEKTKSPILDEQSEFCEVSKNYFNEDLATISNSKSTSEQRPEISFGLDSEYLACTEDFSYDSPDTVNSERQSDHFLDNSDLDFSDYTPSLFLDSGSEFSERSDDSACSPTFSLLLHYRAEFSRSTSPQDVEAVSGVKEEEVNQSEYLKFEDEIDEESYQMLRNREKRVAVLSDYIEDYSSTTEYGGLIYKQRFVMVHWMVQSCKDRDLHHETVFLGVSLLDRFLSKGYFKTKRELQIVGIACLSLATRIEENQPYNSVRTHTFSVGTTLYTRCEVVAMEWLIQEVLNFQCFLPTVFNFLWFYLKAAKAEEHVAKRARYLAVVLLSDQMQMFYPSTVAAAVVILASLEGQDSSVDNVMKTHMRTKDEDLPECIEVRILDDNMLRVDVGVHMLAFKSLEGKLSELQIPFLSLIRSVDVVDK